MMNGLFSLLFGRGRNVVAETAQVFRVNSEAADQRDMEYRSQALQQFAAEFAVARQGRFDRFIDALNRVPRPALAFGTLGLFVAAMVDPIWFAARMQGIALVPEPLWWLMGAIVSFYFGARHQLKSQEFRHSIADTMSRAGGVTRNIAALETLNAGPKGDAMQADPAATPASNDNPALADWKASAKGGQNG